MLKKIKKEDKLFLDVPEQASYAGNSLKRGFYTRYELVSGVIFWVNDKQVEINKNDDRFFQLEKMFSEIV